MEFCEVPPHSPQQPLFYTSQAKLAPLEDLELQFPGLGVASILDVLASSWSNTSKLFRLYLEWGSKSNTNISEALNHLLYSCANTLQILNFHVDEAPLDELYLLSLEHAVALVELEIHISHKSLSQQCFNLLLHLISTISSSKLESVSVWTSLFEETNFDQIPWSIFDSTFSSNSKVDGYQLLGEVFIKFDSTDRELFITKAEKHFSTSMPYLWSHDIVIVDSGSPKV